MVPYALRLTWTFPGAQGVRFHRIVKGFMAQGGDIVKGEYALEPAFAFMAELVAWLSVHQWR